MNSSIIKGQVFHQRFFPEKHQFRYPLEMVCLDVDELKTLDKDCRGFSYNRLGLASIYDNDYLSHDNGSIREKLEHLLETNGIQIADHRMLMVTSPRRLISVFNPVSFYFCQDHDKTLTCVVAEVNNTFGERHVYILKPDKQNNMAGASTAKRFHVSPFNFVEGDYDFRFGSLDKAMDIQITYRVKGQRKFVARYFGNHRSIEKHSVLEMTLKDPLTPHLTTLRILKEAAVLYFKKNLPYIEKPVNTHELTLLKRPSNILQRVCKRIFIREMKRIHTGCIHMTFPDGKQYEFGENTSLLQAKMQILDYDFFPKVVLEGDIGFGEAYVDGLFTTDDLIRLLEVFILSFSGGSIPGNMVSYIMRALYRMVRGNSPNTLSGSRKNIQSHYDLSNDFYGLFLDQGMNYSSGLFLSETDTLEQAQKNKIQGIIDKAEIRQNDHVLEIGSGWGDFAITAATQTGCSVTTITLSRQQYNFVSQRIKKQGLEQKVSVLLTDYRKVTGCYDKIVSIEMLEAVGPQYMSSYFSRLNALLKKNGRIVLQAITLPDQEYVAYRFRLDWIQKHIFPGGHLPSVSVISRTLTRHTPLIIDHLENIGSHYAKTLNHWHQRFLNNLEQIQALGFDTLFQRKWTYYLNSCEAMYNVNALENIQFVLVRPYERY